MFAGALARKRTDEFLRANEAMLRQQTAELAHAARVTTLGELAAAIAHELNQPLTAIAANAQAAIRLLDAPAPDLREAAEALQDVIRDTQRAGETIRRMRSLLWKGDLEKHPLDLNEVVRSIEVFAKADALQSGISLRLDLEPELPRVLADRIQLQQVLLNLVHNGLEAMRALAGSRELIIQTSRSDNPPEALVSVRDAGPPLASNVVQRMFEPFYTTKPGGLGMGLSISRSILEAHGGRLWAEPNPDQGLTVRFTLPAVKENGNASA
jgi:C4-dicarboxylate-specific signal transduction histidine kinase